MPRSASAGLRKIAPRFVGYTQEDHQQPIYSVSFFERPSAQPPPPSGGSSSGGGGAAPSTGSGAPAPVSAPFGKAASKAGATGGGEAAEQSSDPHIVHFASVGANRATVYEMHEVTGKLSVAQMYLDEDDEEQYFACAWTVAHDTREPLLACAGHRGIIKIINCARQTIERALLGHGNSINDVKPHPVDVSLLLSAAKDESVDSSVDRCSVVHAGLTNALEVCLSRTHTIRVLGFCARIPT